MMVRLHSFHYNDESGGVDGDGDDVVGPGVLPHEDDAPDTYCDDDNVDKDVVVIDNDFVELNDSEDDGDAAEQC